MAKKNSLAGMDFNQIMWQQAEKSINEPVYCRFCGKNVKEPSSNSPGGVKGAWKQYLDWEIQNRSHVTCANRSRGRR